MASSPRYKIYDGTKYIGCVKDLIAAAVLVSFLGEGSTIRDGHSKREIIYTEGVDGNAYESYDIVDMIAVERLRGMGRNPTYD